jgi:hypothetical protein
VFAINKQPRLDSSVMDGNGGLGVNNDDDDDDGDNGGRTKKGQFVTF